MTVVVGPNGSGKSNVVDAIAWVLGAQAPSSVRSQKMDDVIFAGTARRPALGRAEVSLTIDNSAGLLPIEFSEVTVTRTLWRSGDSEYAINGVPCRLLDVQELLSDSGVGRQQHVIVSQGQIDGVLNARPEDRRADHRGGGRRPQVPQAQGAGRAPPRGHRGQPPPGPGPAAGGPPPAPAAGAPGRGGPPPRRGGRGADHLAHPRGRSRSRGAATSLARRWRRSGASSRRRRARSGGSWRGWTPPSWPPRRASAREGRATSATRWSGSSSSVNGPGGCRPSCWNGAAAWNVTGCSSWTRASP